VSKLDEAQITCQHKSCRLCLPDPNNLTEDRSEFNGLRLLSDL
jgi:hypothetical protein